MRAGVPDIVAHCESVPRAALGGQGPRRLFILLAVYFGLQCLTRTVISQNLQNDEAEQVLLAQDWSWGYGAQPPLYTWIQKTLFAGLGTNVFALALLKNFFLFSLYVLVFLAARQIFRRNLPAVFASASLLLFPHIVWESQRDQTHLILATACSAAALCLFLRLLQTRRTTWYLLFGVVAGLGALSKYNELFFLCALIVAALTMPGLRPAVLTPRMGLAFATMAVIVAPHVVWFVRHQGLALSETHSFAMASPGSGMTVFFRAIQQLFTAVLLFAGLPVVVYSPLLFAARNEVTPAQDNGIELYFSFLLRVIVTGLFLVAGVVFAFRVTVIRERWLEPLGFAVPILLAGWARPCLERRGARIILFLAGGAAAASLLAMNGTVLAANALQREHHLKIPWPELAAALRAQGFQGGNIVADGIVPGGNLKMQFRDSRVAIPMEPVALTPDAPLLMAWPANPGNRATPDFLAMAERISGKPIQPADMRYVEVPCSNGPRKSERLGFVLGRTMKTQ